MSADDQIPTEAADKHTGRGTATEPDHTAATRPCIAPEEQLSLLSTIERLALAKWEGVVSSDETTIIPAKLLYLERLKVLQRALIFYAHWHMSSFEEIPSEQALINVARYITPPMGEGFEHFSHAMDTWTYRHEFWWLGMAAHEKEITAPRPQGTKAGDITPQVTAPPEPPAKVKQEPSSNLLNGIDGIVIAHRVTWGGAPGGYIQGRAVHFGKRLRNYASWFIGQNDRQPSLYHIGQVARCMDSLGYSWLGRDVGEPEFVEVFEACKTSAMPWQ